MRKSKKTLAILTIIAMVLMMVPVQAFADNAAAPTRLAGSDRIDTAIAIANQGWANGASTVIVAPADDANLVDALAVAPVAGQLNAPILMTYKDSLDSRVQAEIGTLKATNVIAVGALSANAVSQLKAISGVTVDQVQGADRFETAKLLAAKLTNPAGTFVVAYNGLADAMSAASYAAANNYAIMIADTNGALPSSETAVGSKTYTVGGQVAAIAGATSFAGADRYATNDAVLNGLSYQYSKVYVANGETLVDALAGSALAAQTKSPIVLANTSGAAAAADVNKDMTASSQVVAFGGSAVVPDSVVNSIVTGGTVTPPPAANAGLSVSANMSAAASVAAGQYLVNVGTLNLTAGGSDVTVNGLKLTRTGLSKDSDIAHVTVWDGAVRLNAPAIVSSGVADIGFITPLVIKAGTSKTIAIKADIYGQALAGSQLVLSLADSTAIKTTATVTGNFPASSGVLTIASINNTNLGNLTVTVSGDAPSGIQVSPATQDVSLAKFNVQAANEAVQLNSVTFTNEASAADSDITNLKLYSNGVQVGGVGTLVNRKVSFAFDSGLNIANGATVSLELRGDLQASVAGRTIQFAIEDATDIQGIGGTYGTTIVSNQTSLVEAASALTAATGALVAGLDVTSPSAGTVGKGTTGYSFAAIKVQAQNEPIQLQKIVLEADPTGGANASDLQNVAIYSGTTLLGKVQSFFNSTTSNTTATMTLSNPITVSPTTSVVLTVQADLKSGAANGTFALGLAAGTAANPAITAQGMISGKSANYPTTGNTNNVIGNAMTVGSAQLTYAFGTSNATAFGSQPGVTVANLTLSHNLSKNVGVSQININVSASNVLSNMRLTDTSGNALSNTIGTVSSGDNSLRLSTPLSIGSKQNVTVNVVADVISGATTGATLQIGQTGTPITAYTTDDGNPLTTVVGTTGLLSQKVNLGTTVLDNGVNITTSNIVGLGAFSVGLGQKDVKVLAATLSTTTANEPVLLKKVTLGLTTGNNGDFSNVRIVDASGNVLATVGNLPSAGNFVSQSLSTPVTIPAQGKGSVDIAVLADFTSSSKAVVNGDGPFVFQFGSGAACITYNGQNTGAAAATTAAVVNGVSISLIGSTVSMAKVALTNVNPPAASGVEIGRVTFTNTGLTSVDIKKIGLEDVLNSSAGGLSSSGTTTANLMLVDSNSGKIYMVSTQESFNTAGGPDGYYQQLTLGSSITLAPGASKTVSIILSQANGISMGNGLMLKVLGKYTSFDATDSSFSGQLLTGTSAGLDTIVFKSNT